MASDFANYANVSGSNVERAPNLGGPSAGDAGVAAVSPATVNSVPESSSATPGTGGARKMHSYQTGTWECRVHRQCDQLRQMFKLPSTESPIEDFHCALQKKICLQGRLYLFQQHVCFYSNLFGFVKTKVIPLRDVTSVSKRKNVGFPNSIEVVWECEGGQKQEFFTSFLHRREAYRMLVTAWSNCSLLGQQQMSESKQGSRSSPGSSFSGRHGSIASCASLPDDNSLPQPVLGNTTLSRQASEAASSSFDSPGALSSTLPSPEVQASSTLPNSLRHNRAASWGPQSTVHFNAIDASPSPSNHHEQQKTIPAFGGPSESDDGALLTGGEGGEWEAEAGVAPPAPLGATQLLDSLLHVDLHDFCHKFLADGAVFWQEFHESRGDKQIQLTSWSRHTALGHVRELRFVSPVKALIGPPQAECHQSQRYRMYKGNHLVLETSQTMPNIPFGDHFTVDVRWDVTQSPGTASQCRVQSCVSVPFSKATWWKKAIQKGSVDSCREAHQDWLAKVQATLAAPAHVLGPTLSTLAPLQEPHPSRHASFSDTAQGEVDKLVEQLPKEHREAVARVISIASQGSLCASSPRSRRGSALHSEEGISAYKQSSQGIGRMSKTTRFVDSPLQQEGSSLGLTASRSGIPTGASAQWWMVNRLVPALGRTHMLLLVLAFTVICLQVMILLGRFARHAPAPAIQSSLPALSQPDFDPQTFAQLYEGFTSLQQRMDSVAKALAANGIDV